MNPIALYFASGESLYPAAALLLTAIATTPMLRNRWQKRARNVLAWLALCLMVISSPPLPLLVEILLCISFLVWIVAWNNPAVSRFVQFSRTLATATLSVLTLAATITEFSYRKMPTLPGLPMDHLVVIGDSISAGIDPNIPSWPKVFQQATGMPAKNLAMPGAQINEGTYMASKVTLDDRVILIELGGNDLLANLPAGEFEHYLDQTLSQLVAPGRTLIMFELPLLPHKTAYGQVQRRLAKKYGVWLIPKRKFIAVIGGAEATSDGIHLAPEGTRRMSLLMMEVLNPLLKARQESH